MKLTIRHPLGFPSFFVFNSAIRNPHLKNSHPASFIFHPVSSIQYPESAIILFPFNRTWGFGRNIQDNTIDPFNLIDNPVG